MAARFVSCVPLVSSGPRLGSSLNDRSDIRRPPRGVIRWHERPALGRSPTACADPYSVSIPPHGHVSPGPRRYLESQLLVFMNDDALLRDDDRSLAVFPAGIAPSSIVGVAEDQIVPAANQALGIDPLLLRSGEGAGMLLAAAHKAGCDKEREGCSSLPEAKRTTDQRHTRLRVERMAGLRSEFGVVAPSDRSAMLPELGVAARSVDFTPHSASSLPPSPGAGRDCPAQPGKSYRRLQ